MINNNSLEKKFSEHYFIQGLGDGIIIGFDFVGSLYAKIAQQSDLTRGGISLQRNYDHSIGYNLSKSIGFSLGITTNFIANGLPQVAMAIANLEYILSSNPKKEN
jgi:hypothetical protein